MVIKGFHMTREQAEAHQKRHGFKVDPIESEDCRANVTGKHRFTRDLEYDSTGNTKSCEYCGEIDDSISLPRDRMNKTEREYSLILEAMKRRGEILRYEFEGMTLSWGNDPETGKPMRYTPDFVVFRVLLGPPLAERRNTAGHKWVEPHVTLIEVKGGHIRSRDLVRFKGCRAWWPEFDFEMMQKKGGQWARLH